MLIKTLSFVLFSAPDVHLKNLHKMWVDGIMHKAVWAETMKRLNDEWQEFLVIVSFDIYTNFFLLTNVFLGYCRTKCERGVFGHSIR